MRTNHSLAGALLAAVAITLLATPHPAAADDCAADYIACLSHTGTAGSSDELHEQECHGAYWSCLRSQLLFY